MNNSAKNKELFEEIARKDKQQAEEYIQLYNNFEKVYGEDIQKSFRQ